MADRTERKGARVGRGGGGSAEIHYSISSPVPVMHTVRGVCELSSRCQAISPTWGTDPSLFPLSPLLWKYFCRSYPDGPDPTLDGLTHKVSLFPSLPFSTFVLFVRLWQQLLLPPSRGCHLAPRTQSGIKRTAEERGPIGAKRFSCSYVDNIKANARRLL